MAECGQGPCSALTGLGQQLFWLLAMGEVLEATPGGDGEVAYFDSFFDPYLLT